MAPLLPADSGGFDPDLRAELAELVRLGHAIAPPVTELPQWHGPAEDGYHRAAQALRRTIDEAVAALTAARDAA